MKLHSILIVAVLVTFVSFGQVANETYVVDKKESILTWKCAYQFVPQNNHNGFVNVSKGNLTIENGRPVGGLVEVDMNTISDERHDSDNDLIEHLKSADFFDVEKFPVSKFAIKRVVSAGHDSIKVIGSLMIKNITHEIVFPAKIEAKAGVVNANGKVTIDRSKWDVRYGSGKFFANLADDTISDFIEIEMKIVARKKLN